MKEVEAKQLESKKNLVKRLVFDFSYHPPGLYSSLMEQTLKSTTDLQCLLAKTGHWKRIKHQDEYLAVRSYSPELSLIK